MANGTARRLARVGIALVGLAVGAVAGWVAFVVLTEGSLARLLGVLSTVAVAVLGARVGRNVAASLVPDYNVAEVAVEGPITRDGGGVLPAQPGGVPADEVVEQLERADEDSNVDALVVTLNTPGGEVVPSDDIRRAAAAFDGPTVAYATDTCASGGYWIASGCDRFVCREGSIVGSIGVIGSRVIAADLLDRLGLTYERLAAGEYKDAGVALREMTETEREYLQGIVDGFYETFVERVAEGRDMDEAAVRDTEARVYLGRDALDEGLVDAVGTHDDVEDYLADELGEPVSVTTFEPEAGLARRLRGGAASLAYAAGAGVASAFVDAGADSGAGRLRFR
ncbi:MAG: signal peptide peptidase SppA [Halobacteriaceae archaeon]